MREGCWRPAGLGPGMRSGEPAPSPAYGKGRLVELGCAATGKGLLEELRRC